MTKPLVFTGNRFDRAAQHRADAKWMAEKQKQPSTRYLPLHNLKALINVPDGPSIDWRGYADVKEFIEAGATLIFLGIADFACHFAIDVSDIENPKQPPNSDWGKFIDVRSISAQLRPGEAGALAQARSMISWHDNHQFCAVCGNQTVLKESGYSRKCSNDACGASHFPRTDPVAIMMVTKGDKCLMGRGHNFPKGQYSCLAGFIEPGETIEQGVRREVFEETAIKTGDVTYHSSQPWPYPSSLMIGCFTEALNEEIVLDPVELEDARWFSREEVRELLRKAGTLESPRASPPLAIAHQLALAWLNEG
ncbi:NAD(+) diphosphatase [Sneathiella aquimaris]|uniref:NAD(+) diphosphatase n=1 Tax=Sneathiella aquimaris TaxID=2599305 RepID=UPI00146A8312|nr:NAD(+) diphosphatase [Sneathiella aquimaris]